MSVLFSTHHFKTWKNVMESKITLTVCMMKSHLHTTNKERKCVNNKGMEKTVTHHDLLLSSLLRLDSFGGTMVYPSELSEHKHN